jgi:hypothetical protein
MSGSYQLKSLTDKPTDGLFEGRLVVDKTYGYAVHGCASCCPEYDPYILADPLNLTVGGSSYQAAWSYDNCTGNTVQLSASSWGTGNAQVATANITSGLVSAVGLGSTTNFASVRTFYPNSRGYCTWSTVQRSGTVNVEPLQITSIDPTIAMIGSNSVQITINGTGFGPSPTVNLPPGFSSSGQGSSGDTRIVVTVNIGLSATVGNNSITVSASGKTSNPATFQVDGPYHLIVQSDVTGKCSGCNTTISRFVTYQIQNFGGTNAGTTSICETPTFTGWNCTQSQSHSYRLCTAPGSTNSTGGFTDQWSMASDAYTPTGCGFNIVDHWNWATHVPVQDLGTLSGYVRTNSISINGVVSPSAILRGTVIPF